jgi:hypothetical protein
MKHNFSLMQGVTCESMDLFEGYLKMWLKTQNLAKYDFPIQGEQLVQSIARQFRYPITVTKFEIDEQAKELIVHTTD